MSISFIIVTVIIAWLMCGVVGSWIIMEYHDRREMNRDITAGDLVFFGFMAIFGVTNLVVGAMLFLAHKADKSKRFSKVIFKAKGDK